MKKFIELLKRIVFKYYFKHTFSFGKVSVFTVKHKIKFSAFFMLGLLLDKGINEMCMTQEQVLGFCKEFPNQISKDNSQALFSNKEGYYIASINRTENDLRLDVNEIDESWNAELRQRIIIMNA